MGDMGPTRYRFSQLAAHPSLRAPAPTCRELCSYTHPALLEGGGTPQRFRGLNDLKRQLQIQRGLQFCPICLEGRKVRGLNPKHRVVPAVSRCWGGQPLPAAGAQACYGRSLWVLQ